MAQGAAHGAGTTGAAPARPDRFFGLPHSLTGRWAVGSAALFFVFMTVFYGLIAADIGVGESAAKWPLWATIIPAGACGWSAAVLGLESLVRQRERSALVYLSAALGMLVVIFTVGEFIGH